MEQKFTAPIDQVFARLSDAKWLEARSLALDEPLARVKAKKDAKGATVSMTRRVKRDLRAPVAKALPSEAALQFEECWTTEGDGCSGTMTMNVVGQPVKVMAEFSLQRAC